LLNSLDKLVLAWKTGSFWLDEGLLLSAALFLCS